MIIKKFKTCEIKCKYWECCLGYTNVKDGLILCKYLYCNRNYQKKSEGNLSYLLIQTNLAANKFIIYYLL